MERRFLYRIKGYNVNLDSKFKVWLVAKNYDEAFAMGEELAGPGGWIISVKETNKEVFIKGEG